MVLALSGRRIDSPETQRACFPQQNIDLVRRRVVHLFERLDLAILVCSAACGADLLALEACEALGGRRRILLPFGPVRFRETSVVDRPGDWGPIFDRLIHIADSSGDLVNLRLAETDDSYLHTNDTILKESCALARDLNLPIAAALIWDGASKGPIDFTDRFGKAARARGLETHEVSTL
jgi:hypothetical protein